MIQLFVHEMLLDAAQGSLGSVSRMASDILRREPASLIGERCLHAMARMMSAWVGYQRSYRPQAANEMRLALAEYGRGEAWFDQYAIALPLIVDVRFRRDGLAEALRELEAAAHDHDRRGLVCLAGLRLGIELSCRARAGDIADIAPLEARCLDRLESPPGGSAAWRERDMLLRALCALALARRRPEQAARFADRLVVEGREGGRLCTQVQGLVLMARVAELAEDQVRADAVLLEAILLSSAEGMVAAFAEEGRALAPLLQRLASAETSSLAQRRAVAIIKAIKAEQQFAAADALSDREAEIVAHLADGASNKLIARRLGLTENTVKFHLKSIFAKLGVKTRKQAAMRVLLEG